MRQGFSFLAAMMFAATLATGFTAPAMAQPAGCANPSAICGEGVSAECIRRIGAGARSEGSGGGEETAAVSDDDCERQMDRYFTCIETYAAICGGGEEAVVEPAPSGGGATPVADPARYDYSSRSFRIGVVTLSNLRLSPPAPAAILQNENIQVAFDYSVCCAKKTRIWMRPVSSGCSYGASGSPLYQGAGDGSSEFNMRGGASCSGGQVTGLTIQVKIEGEDGSEQDITLPLAYEVQ